MYPVMRQVISTTPTYKNKILRWFQVRHWTIENIFLYKNETDNVKQL